MDLYAAVVLVCSLSTPGPDCSLSTAVDVVKPPLTSSASTCGLLGQAMVAGTAPVPGPDQYVKVVCERRHRVGEMPVADR